MKKTTLIAAGLAFLGLSGRVMAQNDADALRYSQLTFGGTARIQGIAGAQTALGADASTMSANPAGLGLYRKSEFTFSPGVNFNETLSNLNGTFTSDSKNNFNISQMGIVFTDRKADEVVSKWRSGSFGVGFSRVNNFQIRTSYSGTTADKNSFLQSLQDQITNGTLSAQSLNDELTQNGGNQYSSIGGIAYGTYLIDIDTTNSQLFVPERKGLVTQQENIFSRGAQNQWDFSYGASYMDKLFIGASLGLLTVRYEQDRAYTETSAPEEPFLNSYTLNDYFKTSGSGINFKVGLLYKPIDVLRFGATIQTPTFISLTDNYSSSIEASYKPGSGIPSPISDETMDGTFEYNLTTPFRTSGGLAYFIGKYGFVSADVEYVDYGNARFSIADDNPYGLSPGTGYFQGENRVIESKYQGAVNYRFGAEARFDIFRLRGGFALYGDPYKNSNVDRGRNYITGGFGIKEKNYFIDAAYIHSKYNNYYTPYTLNDNSQPVVSTEVKNANFVVTAGFTF